ncbi:MAG: SGNH/GDSL hydrolase family protein [Nocardioides sp.]
MLVSACTPTPDAGEGASSVSPGPPIVRGEPAGYVALGDSYTAAPGVSPNDPADGCFRSAVNYPSLVARALDVELTDRSCSGAKTRDLARRQAPRIPPQYDALTRSTDLVTLGIGGNDFGLYGTLRDCLYLRNADPTGAPCRDAVARATPGGVTTRIERIGTRVADAVEQIRTRAPQARVLVVGYPHIFPESGTCPRRVPLAAGDFGFAAATVRLLSEALGRAARSSGAEYVDLLPVSRGHDVCSDDPWISSVEDVVPLHPLAPEQRAVADLLVKLVRE